MRDTATFITSIMLGVIIVLLIISCYLSFNHGITDEKNSRKINYIYEVLSDPEQIEINLEP